MYCFTCVNGISCVIDELALWSEISSEHPVFIKTVAELTGKNLPYSITERLTDITNMFRDILLRTDLLKQQLNGNPYYIPQYLGQAKFLVEEFLTHDLHFFEVLTDVKQYGQTDAVWQELLEHITKEQRFMYRLFSDILRQIANYV